MTFNDSGVAAGAQVFYDKLNLRLGIGVANPNDQLELSGNLRLPQTGPGPGGTVGIFKLGNSSFMHAYGSGNAFLGFGAGNFATTGIENTGVGTGALANLSRGGGNTALGHSALAADTSGEGNTAVGWYALRATNGTFDTAVGHMALYQKTTGFGNTAIGQGAGYTVTSGSGNVLLGINAGPASASSLSNQLYINNSAGTPLIWGDFSSRRVGINMVTAGATLDVNGTVWVRSLPAGPSIGVCHNGSGLLGQCSSDLRLKRDVVDLEDEFDLVTVLRGLRGVAYSWDTASEKAAAFGDQREIGFIAQEVEAVLPQVVHTDAEGYKSLDMPKLTAVLVEAAKLQQDRIDGLEARLAAMEAAQASERAEFDLLRKQLFVLTQRMAEQEVDATLR